MQAERATKVVWDRVIVAEIEEEIERSKKDGVSERQATRLMDIPRSSYRYWQYRRHGIDAGQNTRDFFESPEGQAFLHRLVVTLHLVISLVVGGGIRPVILVLELLQLGAFVGLSVGVHCKIARKIEEQIGYFGQQERERLVKHMMHKDISLCEDETFHPKPCLVAIEPVSNFIVAEKYAEQRDAQTWGQTIDKGLEGLPVKVIQSISDSAKGILAHAAERGASHSPDLFHIQHDACRATCLALAQKVRAAEKDVAKANRQSLKLKDQPAHESSCCATKPTDQITAAANAQASDALKQAQLGLDQALERQHRCRQAIRGLSTDYHPVDLVTGARLSAEKVGARLLNHMGTLQTVALEASLSDANLDSLQKSHRQLPAMMQTIAFFHNEVSRRVACLNQTSVINTAVIECLVPAAYLDQVASRAPSAQERIRLRQTAAALRTTGYRVLDQYDLDFERAGQLDVIASNCAHLFQRSSSCVEGRNGQLSLRHHHLHSISNRRLNALTVVHNYLLKRRDGTTAAERFFGNKPNDIFEHLLATIPPPPRPRSTTDRSPRLPMLN